MVKFYAVGSIISVFLVISFVFFYFWIIFIFLKVKFQPVFMRL